MYFLKFTIRPILLATLWISASEFARNEYLLKSHWIRHYADMGLVFPAEPINGVVWGLWSLLFAVAIFLLSRKFTILQTALFLWFTVFVMMWVVIGNLGVLPFSILGKAIPLSLLETFVATWLVARYSD